MTQGHLWLASELEQSKHSHVLSFDNYCTLCAICIQPIHRASHCASHCAKEMAQCKSKLVVDCGLTVQMPREYRNHVLEKQVIQLCLRLFEGDKPGNVSSGSLLAFTIE